MCWREWMKMEMATIIVSSSGDAGCLLKWLYDTFNSAAKETIRYNSFLREDFGLLVAGYG
jgi:hypothetical protein